MMAVSVGAETTLAVVGGAGIRVCSENVEELKIYRFVKKTDEEGKEGDRPEGGGVGGVVSLLGKENCKGRRDKGRGPRRVSNGVVKHGGEVRDKVFSKMVYEIKRQTIRTWRRFV